MSVLAAFLVGALILILGVVPWWLVRHRERKQRLEEGARSLKLLADKEQLVLSQGASVLEASSATKSTGSGKSSIRRLIGMLEPEEQKSRIQQIDGFLQEANKVVLGEQGALITNLEMDIEGLEIRILRLETGHLRPFQMQVSLPGPCCEGRPRELLLSVADACGYVLTEESFSHITRSEQSILWLGERLNEMLEWLDLLTQPASSLESVLRNAACSNASQVFRFQCWRLLHQFYGKEALLVPEAKQALHRERHFAIWLLARHAAGKSITTNNALYQELYTLSRNSPDALRKTLDPFSQSRAFSPEALVVAFLAQLRRHPLTKLKKHDNLLSFAEDLLVTGNDRRLMEQALASLLADIYNLDAATVHKQMQLAGGLSMVALGPEEGALSPVTDTQSGAISLATPDSSD